MLVDDTCLSLCEVRMYKVCVAYQVPPLQASTAKITMSQYGTVTSLQTQKLA